MKRIVFSAMFVACAAISFGQTTFYSKYDFVPGDKIIAYEDFSATEIGDFPLKWNTNATAEVVTLNNRPGKWLKINKESVFHPEFINSLPENFTLEFDLGVNEGWDSQPFVVNITRLKDADDYRNYYHSVSWRGTHAVHMEFQPEKIDVRPGNSYVQASKDGNYSVDNKVDFKTWNNGPLNFAHISIWRQKQRLRVYLNGEKIWDIPRVFDSLTNYNAITMAMQGSYKSEDYYVLGNIRLAVGAPDTRNKLLSQGKFVTRGILFSPNTDSLRPESFGALKDISNVLKENPSLKVKIIGHTDADGDDKNNMELSRRRAAAVKNALVSEFGITADNLEVDGKGESAPVDKNTTVEGKANNRRVEFVKLK
jgi:OmpA-OmpF porin, OOP family